MINFKKIIYDIVVAVTVAAVVISAAPAADKPCKTGEPERYYDQRQNGSENYRLNIDGVVIAVAPADSLLAAASEIDFSDLLELEDFNEIQPKPKPPASTPDSKPGADTATAPTKPTEEKPPGDDTAPKTASIGEATKQRRNHKKRGLKLRLANILLPLLKKSRLQ